MRVGEADRQALAIDLAWHGKGLGRAMLTDVIRRAMRASAEISARLVIVHAISPAAEAFYLHYGFPRLPVAPPTPALDLVEFGKINTMPPGVVRGACGAPARQKRRFH